MEKKEYDEMVDRYGGNEFIVNINAGNENNNENTGNTTCRVAGYQSSSSNSNESNVKWLIPTLSMGLLIILVISVVVVYKCVFKKKRKLEVVRSNIELRVNYSLN